MTKRVSAGHSPCAGVCRPEQAGKGCMGGDSGCTQGAPDAQNPKSKTHTLKPVLAGCKIPAGVRGAGARGGDGAARAARAARGAARGCR